MRVMPKVSGKLIHCLFNDVSRWNYTSSGAQWLLRRIGRGKERSWPEWGNKLHQRFFLEGLINTAQTLSRCPAEDITRYLALPLAFTYVVARLVLRELSLDTNEGTQGWWCTAQLILNMQASSQIHTPAALPPRNNPDINQPSKAYRLLYVPPGLTF
jgi:hypothetical protein